MGIFHCISKSTLQSYPGRLTYMDHRRAPLLPAFYWVWSIGEHPQGVKKGRRMWSKYLSYWSFLTLAFLGLRGVRSPDIPALGLCIIPEGSLHPDYVFAQILLKSPQIAQFECDPIPAKTVTIVLRKELKPLSTPHILPPPLSRTDDSARSHQHRLFPRPVREIQS